MVGSNRPTRHAGEATCVLVPDVGMILVVMGAAGTCHAASWDACDTRQREAVAVRSM